MSAKIINSTFICVPRDLTCFVLFPRASTTDYDRTSGVPAYFLTDHLPEIESFGLIQAVHLHGAAAANFSTQEIWAGNAI